VIEGWQLVARSPRWMHKPIQALHGLFGHTPSKTEWGYGGGNTVDTWCRWCNKFQQMPMETARFYFPQLAGWKSMLAQVNRNTSSDGTDQ
jgi:hypothetical protein